MSKILSLQNKQTWVIIASGMVIMIMVIVNILSLVPTVIKVYSTEVTINNQTAIEAEVVNQAIKLLSQTE